MFKDKVELLVPLIGLFCLVMLVGLATNVWQLTFYPIPLMAMTLMTLGTLDREGSLGPAVPYLAVYGVILTALFVWVGLAIGGSGTIGGLPTAMGVFVYILWPFISVTAGLMYALLYRLWISKDLDLA